MNELIMPHNIGVKNALENMKELLALYKNLIGNYRPLLDGERYLTDKEVAGILKVSRRTLQEYRNDGVLPYVLLGGKVLYRESAFLIGNVLIESTQQSLVLTAETLIRVAHHLCRHKSLPIRKMLIMLDDLRLDVIKFAVNLQRLLAATFSAIALYIPHVKRDRLLTTELALSAVNRNPAHHRHHTVLLLTLVHIEQNVKSTFHVFYSVFNFGCKTTMFLGIHRYAKYCSLRNKKRAVRGVSFCSILHGQFSYLQGHKLGYDLAT